MATTGKNYLPPPPVSADFALVGPNHVTALSQQFGDRIDADLLKTAFQRTARTIGVVTGVATLDLHTCSPDCAPSTAGESWASRAASLGKAVLVNFATGEFVVTRDLGVILALTRGEPGYATGVTLPDGTVSSQLAATPGKLAVLVAPDEVSEQLMKPAAEIQEEQNGGLRSVVVVVAVAALAYGALALLKSS